ncbi:molecular chaperone DnaK [Mergibacter septicus]|uniref:Molecular chaperone DnaK n=1 Tax=Mergibacter septicus TaxID=221402 RepID=A0A8E3S6Y7_9PAST|nr:TraR/DksA family transcriptional regulator [Mergibacter septicus]AWX15605.1 molecular chaperone DnaK [Mergibacter septicus]QDJ13083.1 molecular chaperone DnaK [Mergibacter septicus]QDJ14859.1 molecular chaperone DnaK [Mergibacter septicus]UTU47713.1 TraR/DksA family transcriptional regulator [Mergibacter septicus]WMR96680.1 TraR/DksA family transcriptional regulator [Mergibacter septicus]
MDSFDKASQLEQLERETAIRKRKTFKGVSRLYCIECEEPIPELRRQTIQGVTHCVNCQQMLEHKEKGYRK